MSDGTKYQECSARGSDSSRLEARHSQTRGDRHGVARSGRCRACRPSPRAQRHARHGLCPLRSTRLG